MTDKPEQQLREARGGDAATLGRLRQIDLQLQGLRAFNDPDIAAALKLTAPLGFPPGPGGPPH